MLYSTAKAALTGHIENASIEVVKKADVRFALHGAFLSVGFGVAAPVGVLKHPAPDGDGLEVVEAALLVLPLADPAVYCALAQVLAAAAVGQPGA